MKQRMFRSQTATSTGLRKDVRAQFRVRASHAAGQAEPGLSADRMTTKPNLASFTASWPIIVGLVMGLAVSQTAMAAPPAVRQKQVDQAIVRALGYLAAHQEPSGCWKSETFGEMTSTTSLAIMAFLAAGHLPDEGPYSAGMQRGIAWVLDHQSKNGLLVHRTSHGPMYCHGISTLMLAEVVGMVPPDLDKRVRHALQEAVKLILDAQDQEKPDAHAGGWRYQPTSRDSDLSVTGWQLLALRAARNAGCDVPIENIQRAVAYVKRCSLPEHQGFAYQPTGGRTAVRTGNGILALEICGEHHTPEALGGALYLVETPLRDDEPYFYYGAYYCGVGMFQIGGEPWEKTRNHLHDLLLPKQTAAGNWQPVDASENGAGAVYATSLAVLSLAVEYQYLPIYQR